MRFIKSIVTILFLFGVVSIAYGQTPTRLDTVQVRKGLKVNHGIDVGTDINVSGSVKSNSGFGIKIPNLDDPTYVYGKYFNFATDNIDSIGKLINGLEYYCDSTLYKPSVSDSAGIVLKALGIRADNDSGFIRFSFEPILSDTVDGKRNGFFVELSLPDTTEYELYVGLAEKNFAADNKIANGIYFRILDATNKMIFTTARGGSMDSVTAVANTAAGTFYKLAFEANGSGSVTAYVNGTALTTISRYIPRTANLTPFIMVKQGATVVSRQYVYIKNFGFYKYR